MIKFKKFLTEQATATDVPDMLHNTIPHNLAKFLIHVSSPMGHPDEHDDVQVNEVTLLDTRQKSTNANIDANKFPKTAAIIAHGRNHFGQDGETKGSSIHKQMEAGFRKGTQAMQKQDGESDEDHKRRKKKLVGESRKHLDKYAQSVGFKKMPKLLRGNQKTEKSGTTEQSKKVNTTALFLAPHSAHGLDRFDVCPKASKECRANCLGTEAGGNKQYPDTALSSKALRTHALAHHSEHFARVLHHEVSTHEAKCHKAGETPGVRLNGTSDLHWERFGHHVFKDHKKTEFYDYTKHPGRVMKSMADHSDPKSHTNDAGHPSNYHLALSHTGSGHDEANDHHIGKVLARAKETGKNGVVATVWHGKKGEHPGHVVDKATGETHKAESGDADDHLPSSKSPIRTLHLKGVSKERAGNFANDTHDHPGGHKAIHIDSSK